MPKLTEDGALFRLRGRVGGAEQLFDLPTGEYFAGSARTCSLILPDPSVSRRHARLVVEGGELWVEDLASTNGTRVDDRRVARELVPAGAELRLGDVLLTVELAERDDSRLALTFGSAEPAGRRPDALGALDASALERSTFVLPPTGAGDDGLARLEGFVRRLPRAGEGGLAPALAWLGQSLGATGCAVVEWSAGQALVVSGWGAVGALPGLADLRRAAGPGSVEDGGAAVAFIPGAPPLSLAADGGAEPAGLALWGDFPGRSASAGLLRALAACLERLAPVRDAATASAVSSLGELAFPSGYRPGTSPAMAALYEQMRGLLVGDLPVLLHGETGVGKEAVARTLHDSSARRSGPFVAINCAAIPRDLLEAELFGVERGVATGVDPRPGKFEQARGGTLFLDEIGEMSQELQAKLLRALQEKEIQPLGGRPRRLDARLISATNVDVAPGAGGPGSREKAGGLRPDLLYRLAGAVLEIPPLRRCPEDIPGLVEHFLARFSRESGRPVRGVTVAALRLLAAHPWPGNVRELENVLRHLAHTVLEDGILRQAALSGRLRRERPEEADAAGLARHAAGLPSLELEPAVRELEAALVAEALRRTGGRRGEASRRLGLSRNGLYKKMKQLGMEAGLAEAGEGVDGPDGPEDRDGDGSA